MTSALAHEAMRPYEHDDREAEIEIGVMVDGRAYIRSEGVGASRAFVEHMKQTHNRWLRLALGESDTLSIRVGLAAYSKLLAVMDELGADKVGDCKGKANA